MSGAVIRCQQCGETAVFLSMEDGILALYDGRCWACSRFALSLEQIQDRHALTPNDHRFLRRLGATWNEEA